MKTINTLFRLPSLLGAAALTLTVAASTPSYAFDNGACDPSCACPENQYDSSCAYDAWKNELGPDESSEQAAYRVE